MDFNIKILGTGVSSLNVFHLIIHIFHTQICYEEIKLVWIRMIRPISYSVIIDIEKCACNARYRVEIWILLSNSTTIRSSSLRIHYNSCLATSNTISCYGDQVG